MRRLKRTPNYALELQITQDGFLSLPRSAQAAWFVNRIMTEATQELDHLDRISDDFVAGSERGGALDDRTQGALTDAEIMEDWQIPVMAHMAAQVTAERGDILEIGFGRGIGSDLIQKGAPQSHTIIECNDSVVARYHDWRQTHPAADIRLAHGLWQDMLPQLGKFDGIFFHTYPLN